MTVSIYEDHGAHGQCDFDAQEYADLYVFWRVRDGVCRYWLADQGDTDSARRGPSGWQREVEELLEDRAEEFVEVAD